MDPPAPATELRLIDYFVTLFIVVTTVIDQRGIKHNIKYYCTKYDDLRDGLNLDKDEDLVFFLRKVIERREDDDLRSLVEE